MATPLVVKQPVYASAIIFLPQSFAGLNANAIFAPSCWHPLGLGHLHGPCTRQQREEQTMKTTRTATTCLLLLLASLLLLAIPAIPHHHHASSTVLCLKDDAAAARCNQCQDQHTGDCDNTCATHMLSSAPSALQQSHTQMHLMPVSHFLADGLLRSLLDLPGLGQKRPYVYLEPLHSTDISCASSLRGPPMA